MTLIKIGNDNGESRQNKSSLKISDAPDIFEEYSISKSMLIWPRSSAHCKTSLSTVILPLLMVIVPTITVNEDWFVKVASQPPRRAKFLA